jgi:hypothetical protein
MTDKENELLLALMLSYGAMWFLVGAVVGRITKGTP